LLVFAVVSVVAFLFYVPLVGRRRIAAGRRTGLFAGRVVPLVVGRLVLARRRRVMVLATAATVLGRRQRQVRGTRLNGFLGQQTAARRGVPLVVVVVMVSVRSGYYRPVVQGHRTGSAFAAVGVIIVVAVAIVVIVVGVLYVVVEDGTQIVGGRKVFL